MQAKDASISPNKEAKEARILRVRVLKKVIQDSGLSVKIKEFSTFLIQHSLACKRCSFEGGS